jgi:hypothetical protein
MLEESRIRAIPTGEAQVASGTWNKSRIRAFPSSGRGRRMDVTADFATETAAFAPTFGRLRRRGIRSGDHS